MARNLNSYISLFVHFYLFQWFKLNILFFSHFLVKLDAGFIREAEGSHRNSPPRDEIVVVPQGSRIYVQMPGDNVLFGELHFYSNAINSFPAWVLQPLTGNTNENVAYVRMPDGQSLITNLVPFHNGNNFNIQVFRCFIKTQNNTVFGSFLYNNNYALHAGGNSRVFVQVLGHRDPVYSGYLHHADGHRPAWLP